MQSVERQNPPAVAQQESDAYKRNAVGQSLQLLPIVIVGHRQHHGYSPSIKDQFARTRASTPLR
jgi:hypothetical protein